jgi:hypothetical protein
MAGSNNPWALIAAIVIIAIGIGGFWLPKGSNISLIVPAIGACAGVVLWSYTRKK